ncbi:MAG: FliM/FliN family flagellar motor switch protein [Acidobacteria bacterium]|nr:FliM/FliN family flagellar motor switch protein [Acidobacteriota bacterium]
MSAPQPPDPAAAELRRFHRRNTQFARSLQVALATYLRTEISVEPQPVRREPRTEIAAADSGSDFHAVASGPTSTLLLRLGGKAVFPVLEVLLGGVPENTTAPDREITEIERQLLVDFLAVVAQHFDRFWSLALSTPLRSLADEGELARALPTGEQLLILPASLKFASFHAPLSLILGSTAAQASPAEPLPDLLVEDAQLRLLDRMKAVTLTFEVQASESPVALRDLFELKVGQVLVLDHPVDRPLSCRINQGPQLIGRIVRSGDWRAFRLQAPPAD